MAIQAVDLFCSVGGLSCGLHQAGLPVGAGYDTDGACRYAYETNSGAPFIEADIRDLTFEAVAPSFGPATTRVLVGCAPCQPFSSQTRAKGADPRRTLIDEFRRVVVAGRPEVVAMENVPQLAKAPLYARLRAALADAGYHLADGILACTDYGVPQQRRRLVLLASRLGPIALPPGDGQPPRTVRQAIGHLPPLRQGQTDGTDPLHASARLGPVNLQRIRASVPGGTWRDWPAALRPACYTRASGHGYVNVYARMVWDKPAPTLTTQFFCFGSGRYGHPAQDRALSLREGAILQTFPSSFAFVPPGQRAPFTRVGRQIGNAVPPALGRALGQAILQHVKKNGGGP